VWADLKKTSFIIAALYGVMAIKMATDKTNGKITEKAMQ
jgi:hypothetical protein